MARQLPVARGAAHRACRPIRARVCVCGADNDQAPTLPVIDAHHHFFPEAAAKARPPQFATMLGRVETIGAGHKPADFNRDARAINLITTVHLEAGRFYLDQASVAPYLRPVGETRCIADVADVFQGKLCRGIVAKIDFSLTTNQVLAAVAAHTAQLNRHSVLSGVRLSIAYDERNEVISAASAPHLTRNERVVDNARLFGRLGLAVDVWLYVRVCAAAPSIADALARGEAPATQRPRGARQAGARDDVCVQPRRHAHPRRLSRRRGRV